MNPLTMKEPIAARSAAIDTGVASTWFIGGMFEFTYAPAAHATPS
jgi:hypothetical protein